MTRTALSLPISQADDNVARDVDLRGFVYALDAVQKRHIWRLDRLRAELGRARETLRDAQARFDAANRAHADQAEAAGRMLQQRPDPAVHRQALLHLTRLRARQMQATEDRAACQAALAQALEACVAQQLQVETLRAHRSDALAEHAVALRRRHSVEQDRDWLCRAFRSPDFEAEAP